MLTFAYLCFTDGDSTPVQVSKPAATKAPAAPAKAREVPGSKPPAARDNKSRGANTGRGGARNAAKGDRQPQDSITPTDPDSGFEGERRGQSSKFDRWQGRCSL